MRIDFIIVSTIIALATGISFAFANPLTAIKCTSTQTPSQFQDYANCHSAELSDRPEFHPATGEKPRTYWSRREAYSLADAMHDAIWRKNTAARLKFLTASLSACADDTTQRTPSIGLIATC